MSWLREVGGRTYCAVALLCRRPLSLDLMRQGRHVSPPVSLARSYSSNTPKVSQFARVYLIRSHNASRQITPTIQTLDPSRLRSSDFIDISLRPRMHVYGLNPQIPFQSFYYNSDYFPEGTRGFLYYHSPKAGVPPTAGEVRFRLTDGNDPASFVHGSDLLWPNGLPWAIQLFMMTRSQIYQPIKQLLISDALVTPALLERCTAMVDDDDVPQRNSRIIHSFGQPFHFKFDTTYFRLYVPTLDRLQHLRFDGLFCRRSFKPYSGGYISTVYLMSTLLS